KTRSRLHPLLGRDGGEEGGWRIGWLDEQGVLHHRRWRGRETRSEDRLSSRADRWLETPARCSGKGHEWRWRPSPGSIGPGREPGVIRHVVKDGNVQSEHDEALWEHGGRHGRKHGCH